jgi:glucose/mannose transport system substrate-binding protein
MIAMTRPELCQGVETFVRMRDYVDPGSPGRNWNDATNMVMTGQAGMQIHGDWMKGEYYVAGKTAGTDFGCIVGGPGGDHIFTIGGDAFVFPKTDDPAMIEAQLHMAEVMISPEAQVGFNNVKGSVPVRGDVDVTKKDVCAQEGLKALNTPGQAVASVNLLATPNLAGAIQEHISTFWNTPSMTTDEFIDQFVVVMTTTAE